MNDFKMMELLETAEEFHVFSPTSTELLMLNEIIELRFKLKGIQNGR